MMSRALRLRTISTIVMMPIVLIAVYVGGWWLASGLSLFYVFSANEWSRICEEGGSTPVSWLNLFGGLPIIYIGFSGHLALLWPTLALLFAVNLVIPPFIGLSGGTVGMDLFGQIYMSLPLSFLLRLRAFGFTPAALALILVWASDIGAYLVGSAIGRHKLSARLSPGKSWEGLAGGLAFAIITGGVALPIFLHRTVLEGVLIGAAASVLAACGDLGESAIKRWANAKDSGNFMPGHGGFLDRVDSLLFALPALYYLLR